MNKPENVWAPQIKQEHRWLGFLRRQYQADIQLPEEDAPEAEEIEEWIEEGFCFATDGCCVEPDGICEHNHLSWAVWLGYI